MKQKHFSFIGVISLVLILASISSAQTAGKLYSKNEANSIYGPVISSVKINTADLSNMLSKTSNYIMFSIKNGSPAILDNKRSSLYPRNLAISAEEVFHVFSVSIVKELITKGGSTETYIENRKNVLTITNGAYTLEMALACPPFCG